MKKVCKVCKQEKELDLFAKGKSYTNGRRNICKQCHSEYMTEYYKNNKDKHEYYKGTLKTRPSYIRHGISKEKYDELYNLKNGKCHACEDKEATKIDHDHNCCSKSYSCGNCVRGLICHNCNTALGLINDDTQKLKNLIKYLQGS